MTLLLTEKDVQALAPMADAVKALEQALQRQADGRAVNRPRRRLAVSAGSLQLMPAADLGTGVVGFKVYYARPGRATFHVLLYGADTGELLAMIQAGTLGGIRTGAASAVATRHMAVPEASVLGVIGAGGQARTQVEAICTVRPIAQVLVYSRNPEHSRAFAARMQDALRIEVRPVDSPQEAATAPIVTTATNSSQPVLLGEWLSPGAHVNAMGSNSLIRREIDLNVVRRAGRIVVDDREQAALECGDLLEAWERGFVDRERLPELADVVAGRFPGRVSSDEITLFESQGVGLWDVALAELVYRRAREAGRGAEVTL